MIFKGGAYCSLFTRKNLEVSSIFDKEVSLSASLRTEIAVIDFFNFNAVFNISCVPSCLVLGRGQLRPDLNGQKGGQYNRPDLAVNLTGVYLTARKMAGRLWTESKYFGLVCESKRWSIVKVVTFAKDSRMMVQVFVLLWNKISFHDRVQMKRQSLYLRTCCFDMAYIGIPFRVYWSD
ncbi:hypothetical protein BpHYR1_002144 [Brachionus plicatilis]|uniref:Uncharacterized protein n=1 Tax=Brachionus plicatilis TaxID=10195 RepID=A0A3M7QAZ5_BRAPC|nr:hypothetical protein BpHYR1_002144 [Brachionus plicatilis]